MEEIKKVIVQSKKESSTGPYKIHNQMLKNLPKTSLEEIRSLFDKCIALKRIPETWKTARVTMIPKKDYDKTDPNNYRPISVTSCLGKIFEKVMANRLYTFLETNKLLTNNQSGFRKNRKTSDNLFYLTQKVAESFNRGKRLVVCFSTYRKHSTKYGTMD